MDVKDFDYELPLEAIAQRPVEPRDHARLLVVPRLGGPFEQRRFFEVGEYLQAGDLLVVNETRVIPARLLGKRADTGSSLEVFLLSPQGENRWECLVKPGKKARPGQALIFGDGRLKATVLETTDFGGRIIQFHDVDDFDAILREIGQVPLPPYIGEELKKGEEDRYQTVYGAIGGSVAAPTAGLHFTPELIAQLEAKGISMVKVLLHVGLGTFRPVSAERVEDHVMHREYFRVDSETADAINLTRKQGGRIIAVGTTSLRTLESVCDESGCIHPGDGWTDIFLYPGKPIRSIDGLITNFHLPKSTLLMLISAFAGQERIRSAYQEALASGFRFFSFGDAMLIL